MLFKHFEAEEKNDTVFVLDDEKDRQKSVQVLYSAFKGDGKVNIIITTEAIAIGLNLFATCAVVLTYMPKDFLAYKQIAGRANRVDFTATKDVHYVTLQKIFDQDAIEL